MERIGIVGAGLMGAEIALVYALAGHDVLLADRDEKLLANALERLRLILEKGVARGFYRESEPAAAFGRVRTTTDLAAFADRDLVIEAVFEDEAVKAEVHARLDAACGAACILASNTSTIPISTLARHVRPERRPRFSRASSACIISRRSRA
jgi:3-hydroxybutyryl-CoA dehydrogenase